MTYTHQFPAKAISQTWYQPYVNSGKPPKSSSNLRQLFGPIRDQMQLGSCSSFSSTNFRSSLLVQEGKPYQVFSALAQYYQERVLNGTVSTDSGATMQEAMQVLETYGVMPDADWPYLPNYLERFKIAPPADKWDKSLSLNAMNAKEIQPATILEDTIDALSNGSPVLIGFVVFPDLESQEVADNGYLPMPLILPDHSPFFGNIGGHMVVVIGHDDSTQQLLCLNQWSAGWGIKQPEELQGCFYMPYAYYKQYAFNPMVYPQGTTKDILYKYDLSVSTPTKLLKIGDTADIFVSLSCSPAKPLLGDEVVVTVTSNGVIKTSTEKLDASGGVHFDLKFDVPQTVFVSASFHDSMGVQYLNSIDLQWAGEVPVVDPKYSVSYEVTLTSSEQEASFLKYCEENKVEKKKL